MDKAEARDIPLYPELRACVAPSAARVLEIFEPEMTPLQLQVLDLLGIPASAYTT